jgi:membrane protease YdiL (CAAX protease family)
MTTAAAFHRLAVHHRQRWWKPVLATAALIFVAVIVQTVLYAVVYLGVLIVERPADPAQALSGYVDVGLGLASIAIALPLVLLAARYTQSRPAGSVSSVSGRLRFGWLGLCLALATLTTGLMIAGSVGLMSLTGAADAAPTEGGRWVGTGTFVGGLAMLLVLVPLQAAAEEYLFRGWLLQAIGAFARSPWPAIAVQAVLFAALHGWGTPWGFVDLVAFGVVLGWLTVRTGGLEAAIALHVMNNLILMVLAAADGSLTLDETAADMPWAGMVVDTLTVLAYAAAVTWLARRRRVQTRAPADGPPSTAADADDEAGEQIGDGVVGEVAAAHADG